MNLNHKSVAFCDIAALERAQKGEIYNNCILIQLSASNGQIELVKEPQTVESKFGIIKTKDNSILLEYLYCILEMQLPDFLSHYQNGININPQIFTYLRLDVHTEIETQCYAVKMMAKVQQFIDVEEKILQKYQQVKEFYLDGCFCE